MAQDITVTTGSISRRNGKPTATTIVHFGDSEARRSVEFSAVGIEKQFDLAEFAPDDASRSWRAMALVALSIENIDGRPSLTPRNRNDVRQVLKSLGDDGFEAIIQAQTPDEPVPPEIAEAAHRAQVGNSPEPPVSGG